MTTTKRCALVIGPSGQVGGALVEALEPEAASVRVVGTWHRDEIPGGVRLDRKSVV